MCKAIFTLFTRRKSKYKSIKNENVYKNNTLQSINSKDFLEKHRN